MLDKQPCGKGYEQKNWYRPGSPLNIWKEGRDPGYDRASAPASNLLSLTKGIEHLICWVNRPHHPGIFIQTQNG